MLRIGRCELTHTVRAALGPGWQLSQGRHEGLDREITALVSRPGLQVEPEPFRTRAKALSRLAHPHLARVLDFGLDEGRAYLILERLAPLPPPGDPRAAAGIAAAAAEALQALEQAGLGAPRVERLLPLLGQGSDGRAVLVPWPEELAVAVDDDHWRPGEGPLPPVGVSLYQLLTGKPHPPPEPEDPRPIELQNVSPRQRAWSDYRRDMPTELGELVADCALGRGDRTLAEVARALRDYERTGSRTRGLSLRLLRGAPAGGYPWLYAPGVLRVGRGSKVDLALADDKVSRSHCELRLDDGGAARVVDLGSSHGTLLNDARLPVGAAAPLADGDVLLLGATQLKVQLWEGCPPPEPPLVPWWSVQPLPAFCESCGSLETTRREPGPALCGSCRELVPSGYQPLPGGFEQGGRFRFVPALQAGSGEPVVLEGIRWEFYAPAVAALRERLEQELGFLDALGAGLARGRLAAIQGSVVVVWDSLAGPSLARRLREGGAWPWERAWPVLRAVGAALAAAHAAGHWHGEVEAWRVRFSPAGEPRLLWSLRVPEPYSVQINPPRELDHLPPEQIESEVAGDARSDVYGFAALAHRLLLARSLFPGKDLRGQLMAILHQPPDLEPLRALVPAGVVDLLARALAKKPEDRFADLGELLRALEGLA